MAKDLLEAARSFRDALARFEPGLVSGQDCAGVAEELARTEKACAAARALAARRAARARGPSLQGLRRRAGVAGRTTGSSVGEAKAALDTAAALDDCPETKNALLAGEVSGMK